MTNHIWKEALSKLIRAFLIDHSITWLMWCNSRLAYYWCLIVLMHGNTCIPNEGGGIWFQCRLIPLLQLRSAWCLCDMRWMVLYSNRVSATWLQAVLGHSPGHWHWAARILPIPSSIHTHFYSVQDTFHWCLCLCWHKHIMRHSMVGFQSLYVALFKKHLTALRDLRASISAPSALITLLATRYM